MCGANDYRNGKNRKAGTVCYRRMTADEARNLNAYRAPVREEAGNVREAKVNGSVKTWKRSPERVEVPLKYGLYEYWRDIADSDGLMQSLVVITEEAQHGTLHGPLALCTVGSGG